MLSALHRQASSSVAGAPWHRRLLAVLVSLAMLVLGAPAATASVQEGQPGEYRLEPTRFGSERHRLIQMFRIRHPEVSEERNVAAYFYEDENQATWVVVTASIGRRPNNRPNTPIDVFRKAPGDGDWKLIRDGSAFNWRSHREPSDEWTADERPELRGLHAENIGRMYLAELGTADLVPRGITENIPCEDRRNACRENLADRAWLANGVDDARFEQEWRGLSESANRSFSEATTDPDGRIWFGAVSHPMIPDGWATEAETTSQARRMIILVAAAGGAVIVLGMSTAIFFAIRSGRPR